MSKWSVFLILALAALIVDASSQESDYNSDVVGVDAISMDEPMDADIQSDDSDFEFDSESDSRLNDDEYNENSDDEAGMGALLCQRIFPNGGEPRDAPNSHGKNANAERLPVTRSTSSVSDQESSTSSACEEVYGKCVDSRYQSNCYSQKFHSGICPGSSYIKCCVPGSSSACDKLGGSCLNTYETRCRGSLVRNKCPGPSHVVCCQHHSSNFFHQHLQILSSNHNRGLSYLSPTRAVDTFGTPGNMNDSGWCKPLTNRKLQNLMVTDSVGPFRVTGLRPAVAALKRVFSRVKNDIPQLYYKMGTAGMLCVRQIGTSGKWSNHSFGCAIDLTIGGKLDRQGDGWTQKGLELLAPYFHAEKFFWGATFGSFEDSMHFECSRQLIDQWKSSGMI